MKIISLSSFRVNFIYLFHFVYYITKTTLTLTKSKYNFDKVKYHFCSAIASEKKVSPYLARRVNIAPQAHRAAGTSRSVLRQHRF